MPILKLKNYACRIFLPFFLFLITAAMTGCGQKQKDSFILEQGAMPGEAAAVEELPSFVTKEAEDISRQGSPKETDDAGSASYCVIHICGAVRNPGVYELPEGSRIMDAVTAGGGFLPQADENACNLAAKVTDGCQIYIMTLEESRLAESVTARAGIQPEGGIGAEDGNAQEADGKVNLNTAREQELKTLPGIGDSRAAAILAWRREHGRFEKIEDIMKVNGIKQAAFDKIKEKIKV